jgi:hypothetical protein
LASHVADTGADLFEIFDGGAIEAWADLVARVGATGRNPHLLAYPERLATLEPRLHERLVRVSARADTVVPQEIERVLVTLADAAASLPETSFCALLEAVEISPPSPELTTSIALVPAVTHELESSEVSFLLEVAARAARELPAVLPALLRTMGRALEHGGRQGIEAWVRVGLEIGRDNPSAARAHFRLETRTAHKVLSQHTAAVTYDEIESLVQRYLRMMARRTVRTTSGSGIWLRPPLAASDEPVVRLPERVDLFADPHRPAEVEKLQHVPQAHQ